MKKSTGHRVNQNVVWISRCLNLPLKHFYSRFIALNTHYVKYGKEDIKIVRPLHGENIYVCMASISKDKPEKTINVPYAIFLQVPFMIQHVSMKALKERKMIL